MEDDGMPGTIIAAAYSMPLTAMAVMLAIGWLVCVLTGWCCEKKAKEADTAPKTVAVKREAAYYMDKQRHPVCKIRLDKKEWRRFRIGKTVEHVDPDRLELFVHDAEFDAYCYDRLSARYKRFRANKKSPKGAVRRACLGTYRYALYRMEPGIRVVAVCRGRRAKEKSEFIPLLDAHAWLHAVRDFKGHPKDWIPPEDAFKILMGADYKCRECGAELDGGSPVTVSKNENGRLAVLCGRCRAEKLDKEIAAETAASVQEAIRRKKEQQAAEQI